MREVGVRHFARLAGRSKVGLTSAPGALHQLWTLRRTVLATSAAPASPAIAAERRTGSPRS